MSAYAIALTAVAGAVLLRWLLDPVLGNSLALVTMHGAVAIAVWAGGYRPATLAAAIGFLACDYLFIPPRQQLSPITTLFAVGLLAYAFTCLLIIWIGQAMRDAQLAAGERGELLRVTLASIGDAVITTDTRGRVKSTNAVAQALTGWNEADAVGQPLDAVFRIIDEETRQHVESPVTRALRDGCVAGLANHTLLIAKDGTELPIDDSAGPIRDADEAVVGAVLIFRDVSRRRQWERSEAERFHSARLLAAIVESSDDAIVGKSLDGTIQSWNAGAQRLFGYQAQEAIGRHISLLIPPDRLAEETHIINELKAGRRVDHFETVRLHKSGDPVQVSLTISPIRDAAGRVVGASKIARDISSRARAEAERQKFVTLVENSTDFIAMCDTDGKPFYVNRAGLEMVGLESLDEARRVHVRDFFFPEDQKAILDQMFAAVKRDGHAEVEVRFRHFRTREALWMAYKVVAVTDEEGRQVAFATVSQDMTQRRHLEGELRKLAQDLSEADHRKNEFLATLAHELRNPLAPLRNLLELLKKADADRAVRVQAVETMQRQLNQLVRLVDDLLDLSRISHDRLELRRRPIDIAAVIRQALESCQPLADAAAHQVHVELPAEPLYVNGDELRLTQVLANLFNNSCKYTDPGGAIEIKAVRDADAVVVTVKDNGIGIPTDKLEAIFGMFTQVEPSAHRSQSGLGIGLTLAKRLVEMHGGALCATSKGLGRGSEFAVRLPLLAARPEPNEMTGSFQANAAAQFSARRILVVDDNTDAAVSLVTLLQMSGHDALVAHDGAAAIEAMARHRPEIVLLDIGLPLLNGYEVCRRARLAPWGRDMVLIALTGWGQEKDLQASREAGFDGHLVKPVDYAALVALMSTLVGGS